jgi:hypothetical protein
MDIGAGNGYPQSALSNFAPHPFVIDGVQCNSMEGFLQSLKFESQDMQQFVCTLVGKTAKFRGKKKKWYRTQTLYWRGKAIKRDSEEYQNLLNKAYNELYKVITVRKDMTDLFKLSDGSVVSTYIEYLYDKLPIVAKIIDETKKEDTGI